ncbi:MULTISPECIES: Slp family lipoprotein [Oleiagrimonas]|uniref:Slp/YeaY family lipoprotein n=1 Tax=Oleiagrimonas citrea TaxID=1665687 RepID=A0A846ZJG8_9GAMM|nr:MULTISPECIES: Slp family lipoprotein [Oleiagrimonas]NKZ37698.1 Slp/YeaY family lipoprotein [Oleiagrimonas citrea]RAP56373.1 hypothetical protein BTJ49_13240 [Oleiagrimonas sp. MCCC 1A03011]
MSSWKLALVAAGALTLGACATIPKPLEGTYAQVTPQAARSGASNTAQVRWGGQIIRTEPEAGHTCFYVLAHPLDASARPRVNVSGEGRFVACHSGFYDPEIFVRGREVTFTGTLHGIVSEKVGKYDYPYPRLEANTVYLWPKRPRYTTVYRDPWYDPFWGPSPFWGSGYWSPYYYPYAPRVIVVPQKQRLAPTVINKGK